MTRGMRELAYDALTLGELQFELAMLDSQQWTHRLIMPGVLFAGALGITVGAMPVLLHGVAYALIEGAEWPHWLSFLVAGLVGLATAAILGYVGWRRFQTSFMVFERTRSELRNNIDWLKNVLKEPCPSDELGDGRSPRFTIRKQEIPT